MVTQDFKFERLSNLEMSKLSGQEMAVTFGGYEYWAAVHVYEGNHHAYMYFLFDSADDFEGQYEAFQPVVLDYLHEYLASS